MDKPGYNDIASFPELFDGSEQFIEEQLNALRMAGRCLTGIAFGCGMALYFLLDRLP